MSPLKVFALAGSLRTGSYNRQLLKLGIRELEKGGVEVDVYDLKISPLPVYDGDVEAAGFPDEALRLKERIGRASGLLLASPEYNHGIPGGLKNAIDWASRPLPADADHQPHPFTQPFQGKLAALLGATPGRGGTVYSQLALREVLNALGVWTMPGQMTVSQVGSALDPAGELIDKSLGAQLADYLGRFLAELKKA